MRCARCQEQNPDIARFCNQCGAPLAPSAPPQLRRLTVMFCDLVGSVELANQLDPEDWHALLGAYQQAAGAAIRRHHGHVAQHLGDGVVAYFGYPLAAEDDAVRAVQCALELVQDVAALPVPQSQAKLRVRVGLHTGATVMGHVGGSEGEYLALGDTPNIAARIQALAPVNGVLLSPATHTVVEAHVRCAAGGEYALKGLAEPMRLYQALGMLRGEEEEGAVRGWSPFLGRQRELELLVRRWQEAAAAGQCVLLLGEPGIGKSRLARELREQARRDQAQAWVMRCSAHGENTPFAPLAQLLPQALAGDPALGAHALRERTFATASSALRLLVERGRALVIIEDLHWADPSTLEWLGRLLHGGLPAGLLLLLLARTEFEADWANGPQVERVSLDRWSADDTAAMIAALDREGTLGQAAVARIVERAEGNPLFVEEFTRSSLEAEGGEIPLTLQEQTMARLDRLGAAKQVLQQAAVIGRHFSRRQLCAASGLADDVVEQGLRRGIEAHMLRPAAEGGSDGFAFHHALLRDAAYSSLLRSARQASHARVAQALQAEDPDSAHRHPELLAHHYTEAGQAQPAMTLWLSAGRLALARSACIEAAAHARTALRLLGDPGDDEAALALELELRLVLAPAQMALSGVLDAQVAQAYSRARELCERLGNGPRLLEPLWGLWGYELMRGELAGAHRAAAQLTALAEATGQPVAIQVAASATAMTLFYQGDVRGALAVCAQALPQFRLPPFVETGSAAAPEPGAMDWLERRHCVMCLAFHDLANWVLGDTHKAMAGAATLRELAASLPPFDAAYAWCSDAFLHTLAGDAPRVAESSARAIAIGFPAWQMMGLMMQGWARARQGETRAGLAQMRRTFDAWCAGGVRNLRPFFLALMADGQLAAGDAEQAAELAEQGLGEAAAGEHCWEPELLRLRAEALAQLGETAGARDSAQRAVAAADRMGARTWADRAGATLARILRQEVRSA